MILYKGIGLDKRTRESSNETTPRKRSSLTPEPRKQSELKMFKCDQCNKSYISESGLKSHIEIVHDVLKVKCDFCDERFESANFKRRHCTEVHGK